MFSTPHTKGALATSTPIQPLEDSGYYGSSGKLSLELHTLSPIKEISSNCHRTPDLIEFPKFRLSQEFDSVLDSSDVIRELDFTSGELFDRSLKNITQINSFPSFQLRDLSESSDDGICMFAQFTSLSPLKKKANLDVWLSLFARHFPQVPKQQRSVDILKELKQKNLFAVIDKILSRVSAADLCKISCVSKTWNKIVRKDADAKLRKNKFLAKKSSQKENLIRLRGVEESSCKEIYLNSNGALFNNGNVDEASKKPLKKIFSSRFDSFLKEGETCKGSTKLMKCPNCKYAAKEHYKNLCLCTECKYAFCRVCFSPFQNDHKCSAPKEVPLIVGSKVSKRNLKRL